MPDRDNQPKPEFVPLSTGEELGLLRQSRKFPNDFQTEEVLTKFGLLNEKTLVAAIDLELTCWESPKGERTGYSEIQEVIEIGVVLADLSGKEITRARTFVRPVDNPILSDFCIGLTGITQADVDSAPTFPNALSSILAGLPEPRKFVFASFGRDPEWLHIEMERKVPGTGLMFDPRYINLGLLHKLKSGKNAGGMKEALEAYGIPMEQPQHRALPDAIGVHRLVSCMELNPLDASVGSNTNYRQRIETLVRDRVHALLKQHKLDPVVAERLLRLMHFDVPRTREVIKLLSEIDPAGLKTQA